MVVVVGVLDVELVLFLDVSGVLDGKGYFIVILDVK